MRMRRGPRLRFFVRLATRSADESDLAIGVEARKLRAALARGLGPVDDAAHLVARLSSRREIGDRLSLVLASRRDDLPRDRADHERPRCISGNISWCRTT